MLKKSKLFIGVLTSMTLVFTSITTAFAEENVVSKTQDNITVTKTAEWTTVDGKSTDASGNRYAKINFKIDTTNATTEITNTVSRGGDTDIVLILDDSGSMSGDRVRKLKETANDFINTMLSIPDTKVRLGVVAFKKYDAEILSPMSQDKAALTGSLSKLIAECGADNPLQCGIKKGHEMLNGSTAANKFFVVLSDGGIYTYPQAEELSIQYLQQAQAQYPELKAI
jgi:Mg-chelatase subunit ChlD